MTRPDGKLLHTVILILLSVGVPGCTRTPPANESTQSSEQNQVNPADEHSPFFQDVTDQAGLTFRHTIGDVRQFHFPDIMVAGCGVIDFDRDGLLDVITIDSGNIEDVFAGQIDKRKRGHNRLFRQSRLGFFEDVTSETELMDRGYGCGVAVGDVNNDGYEDIYFANYGPDKLLINVQGKKFQDVTAEAGIQNPSWGSSATMFDYDRDGRVDIFVTNYVSYISGTHCANAGDPEDFCSPRIFEKTVDKLFRNVSEGTQVKFEDVTATVGLADKKGPGLGVIARDFNSDGLLDLYVANDGWENFLWINEDGKKFSEQAGKLGCAMSLKGDAQAGMGVDAADVDGNGTMDIVVTHLDGETNAAYLASFSNGQLFFTESGGRLGVQKMSKPMTGFGISLADLDLDGDLDWITVNGRVTRRNRLPGKYFWVDYAEKNQIGLNIGHGKFSEFTSSTDPFLNDFTVSRGLAILDFNNDGQLDCLVSSTDNRIRLYQNVKHHDSQQSQSNWVGFRVTLPDKGNRVALGAVVELELESGKVLKRSVRTDGSYQSAQDPRVHFGLGADRLQNVQVTWVDGTVEAFEIGASNRYHLLQKGAGTMRKDPTNENN